MNSRRLVEWLVALLLLASVASNLLVVMLVKRLYGESKTAAIFFSHSSYFRESNESLGVKNKPRIVLFGDSRIAQWYNFPNPGHAEVVHRGIEGETTAQLRTRFEQDVLALEPDIVVLQMGINDFTAIGVLAERKPEIVRQCGDNISYMVNTLITRGVRTILLTIIPPRQPDLLRRFVWSDDIETETEKFNRFLQESWNSPLLHVIDTAAALRNQDGTWKKNVNEDTLHLTILGYQYLNSAVLPLIKN